MTRPGETASADARTRRLQHAASTGDPEAAVALLVERIRAGTVSDRRAELGAWLGDATCMAATGVTSVDLDDYGESLARFLGILQHLHLEAWIRALFHCVVWGVARHGGSEGTRARDRERILAMWEPYVSRTIPQVRDVMGFLGIAYPSWMLLPWQALQALAARTTGDLTMSPRMIEALRTLQGGEPLATFKVLLRNRLTPWLLDPVSHAATLPINW